MQLSTQRILGKKGFLPDMWKQHQGRPRKRQVRKRLVNRDIYKRHNLLQNTHRLVSFRSSWPKTELSFIICIPLYWQKPHITKLIPEVLPSKDQRVLLKSHGAVCGRWSFFQNQSDQQFKNQLLVHRVFGAEDSLKIHKQTGQEQLQEQSRSISNI